MVDGSTPPSPMPSRAEDELGAALAQARAALERGDYGTVRRLLEPLLQCHPPATSVGAGVRLLLATALMGQGETSEAASLCRTLQGCGDGALRARARELLFILEAPVLRRPRDWSLTLPPLQGEETLRQRGLSAGRRRPGDPPPEPPPPVGTTRQPLGFVALVGVALALLLLASLLGGCMAVRTDLQFGAPGRLQISHALRSRSGALTPWQRQLGQALEQNGAFQRSVRGAEEVLRTPMLPAAQALTALEQSLGLAAQLGGVSLPPPRLVFREHNWLVGVRQDLAVALDLQAIPARAGLELAVGLAPVAPGAVVQATPLPVQSQGSQHLLWPLQPGSLNQLRLHCWRWSRLGLGAAAVAVALVLTVALQRLRRALGFGLPELPA